VFFKRLRNVLVLWLGLLVLLAFFSTVINRERDYNRVESALVDGLLPVFSLFTAAKKSLLSVWNRYFYLVDTQRENEKLKKQIARLREENVQLRERAQAETRLSKLLQLKTGTPGPSLSAEVVGRGPSPFLQALFINKGRRDGLQQGMPVLHPDGLVGRLERTADHYSQVLLLNDPGFLVDCLTQRSRVRGIWTGSPEGYCQIKYVSRNDDIQAGDIIITSGLDRHFPKGLYIGRVKRVISQTRGNFLFVEAVPEVDLGRIEEVQILPKKPSWLFPED
jgi:rod shape-determining protein MreC